MTKEANNPRKFDADYYKKAFEDLHKKSQEDNISHKNEIEILTKRYEEFLQKQKAEAAELFNKMYESYPLTYAQTSFSEGFLGDKQRYKISVTKPPTKEEISVLIAKLEFDKETLFKDKTE